MKPVFSPKSENYFDKKQLLGAYVEKEYSTRLALFSLLKRTTRSSILQKLIINYIEANVPSTENLMETISIKIMEDWLQHQSENRNNKNWDTSGKIERHWQIYVTEIRKGLKSHKLPPYLISEIITVIEEKLRT